MPDIKVSQLPLASAPTGLEYGPFVQAGELRQMVVPNTVFTPQMFGSPGPTLDTTNETDYRDNYDYIVAALAAANSANGGTVFLSGGLWIIGQPLVIPYDNVWIVGVGKWANNGINFVPGTTFGTRIRLDSGLVQTAVKFQASTLRNLYGGGMVNLNIDGGNYDGFHGGTDILQLHATTGTRLLGIKLDRAGSGGYGLRLDGRNNLNCGNNLIMDLEVVVQGSGQSALGMNVDATNDATGGGCSRNVFIRCDLAYAGDVVGSHGISMGFADNNFFQEVLTLANGAISNPTGKALHFIPQIIRPEFAHENTFVHCPLIGGIDGTPGTSGNWFIPYPSSDGETLPLPVNCYGVTVPDGAVRAGNIAIATKSQTLVNGLNSNISFPDHFGGRLRITGPTGAFSVGGFALPDGPDGWRLSLYNSTSQAMTIVNEDGSSTAVNRIKTLTGGNVTLRAGTSFVTFSYDGTDQRWILEASN